MCNKIIYFSYTSSDTHEIEETTLNGTKRVLLSCINILTFSLQLLGLILIRTQFT